MMAVKPTKHADNREVVYSPLRWERLRELRGRASGVMAALEAFHLGSIVHGSVARGDVNAGSDVDVFVPEVQNSFLVETALERAGFSVAERLIVMATPLYAVKGHIMLDEVTCVSFPLVSMRRVEREFYRFGGEVNLAQLKAQVRVAGVDKRLVLIEPTERGHAESGVVGREEFVAKILGVSAETVQDRVHALLKRDKVGRTGVFIKKELSADETFELALKKLCDANPAVRRKVKKMV